MERLGLWNRSEGGGSRKHEMRGGKMHEGLKLRDKELASGQRVLARKVSGQESNTSGNVSTQRRSSRRIHDAQDVESDSGWCQEGRLYVTQNQDAMWDRHHIMIRDYPSGFKCVRRTARTGCGELFLLVF